MNQLKRCQMYLAAGACATVILGGCASTPPPTEQIAVSKSAIHNAASAGGAEYAPAEMRSAQDKLDRANRAMQKNDYDEARQYAEQAQADARLAEQMANSAKARKSAAVMQDDIRVLREELARKTN